MIHQSEKLKPCELTERANAAWVDYEPPETAGAQTHRQTMICKHAFVSGYLANTRPLSMTGEIPASVQNITPECRANRTSFGALEEAVSRIQQAYVAYHDAPANKAVTWRISLVRVEPPAAIQEQSK